MSKHPAFRAALERNPTLAPVDGTVLSFIVWLQMQGIYGERLQGDLFETYQNVCELAGYSYTPRRRFKQALIEAGCTCWQTDTARDGRRHRPEMVFIPKQS